MLIRKISLLGLLVLVAVYAIAVIGRPTISPEISEAFVTLSKTKTLGEALGKFLVFDENWYRPLTFYLTNFFVFRLIDIHSIYLIKTLSLLGILLNAYVVTELALTIFGSSLIERMVIFALVVSHPLYFSIAYEGSGIVDPVFNIALNLFLISFWTLLENEKGKVSKANRLWVIGFCGLFILGAVTSQERGLAFLPMMGGLFLLHHWPKIRAKRSITQRLGETLRLAMKNPVVVFGVLLAFAWWRVVFAPKGDWSGPTYRSQFDAHWAFENLIKAFELPLRLFFRPMEKHYDAHYEWGFNLLGAPFLLLLLAYVGSVFRRRDAKSAQERHRLSALAIFFVSALVIPVIFGSNAWHFYTAALYASIATGRAFWYYVGDPKRTPYFQGGAIVVAFALLTFSVIRGIDQELAPERPFLPYMMLTPKALEDRTLHSASAAPEVVFYDTFHVYEGDLWPFGSGHLFEYVYGNTNLIAIALDHAKVFPGHRDRCGSITGKRAIYVGFEAETLSWRPIEAKNYCASGY